MAAYVVSGASTTSSNITLNAGDTMSVFSGGTVSSIDVNSGGDLEIYDGGVAVGTNINYRAAVTVSSGGTLRNTSAGASAGLTMEPGAQATATTIGYSATFIAYAGAVASDTTINYGATLEVSGGTLDTVTMQSGVDVVYAGGVVSGATLEYAVDLVISSGGTVHAANLTVYGGTETVLAGGSADFSLVGGGSIITVSSGGTVANLSDSSGTVHLDAGAVASGFINLEAASSTLIIDGTTMPGATVSGFVSGRTIDLTAITSSAGASAHLGSGNLLSVTDGAQTYALQLDPTLNYGAATFAVTASGGGVVLTTSEQACFLAGTLIETDAGAVPVETLRPGHGIRLADGGVLPMRWLGVSTVAARFVDPVRAFPVRIRAGALGEGVPARDLLLSPGHAVLVGGVLVHAGALVNGVSVLRETAVPERFHYYHVELATHALLLAERLAAESYLEGAEKLPFDNHATRIAPAQVTELPYPRAKSPRQVPRAARERLAARALHLFSRPAAA